MSSTSTFHWATLITGEVVTLAGLYWNRASAASRAKTVEESASEDRRRATENAEAAKNAAEAAARAVAPVGNGFANEVRVALAMLPELKQMVVDQRTETRLRFDRIENAQVRTDKKLDTHIHDHALEQRRRL